jgi:putative heme-binding domain-containing protein
VRFLAAKWVADEKLTAFRPLVAAALQDRGLNARMYAAYVTALSRLDDREVSERRMADYFVSRLADDQLAAEVRARMLQLVPATHHDLKIDLLGRLLVSNAPALQREAVRALCEHPAAARFNLLRQVAGDSRLLDDIRAQAIAGLSEKSDTYREELLGFARSHSPALRNEALRGLTGTALNREQRSGLGQLARSWSESAPLVARVLGQPFVAERPKPGELDAWLHRLQGPADAAAGRRIFFHTKLAMCSRCHRVEGRGHDIGPDLSDVSRSGRRHILESILQPSNLVPPYYQAWNITTTDGKSRMGMLVATVLDVYTYVDAKGELFKVHTPDVIETRAVPVSIMPDGLVNVLTDQEVRDLLAYLSRASID